MAKELEKIQILSKTTRNKQVNFSVPKVGITAATIDNHMVVIQVQIGKNTIEDVLLDGGSRVNIITKHFRLKLGLLKPKHAPYNVKMENQTTAKLVDLIRDLKIYVHDIPYIITFIVPQNCVVNSNYSMLLGRPWLRDAKVGT